MKFYFYFRLSTCQNSLRPAYFSGLLLSQIGSIDLVLLSYVISPLDPSEYNW